jgi:hypothetical protein
MRRRDVRPPSDSRISDEGRNKKARSGFFRAGFDWCDDDYKLLICPTRQVLFLIFRNHAASGTLCEMPTHEKARDRFGPRADFFDDGHRPLICPSTQAFFPGLIYDAAFAYDDNRECRRCLSMD